MLNLPKISLFAVAFGLGLSSPIVMADEAEGMRIAKERKARDLGWNNSEATVTMILRNARGKEVNRDLKINSLEVSDDGDKVLTVFNSPGDIKGTAFLSFSHPVVADEQWIYLPALKRVKRIATKNKSGPFVGSEFAFEDMTSFEIEKFTYNYLRDDVHEGVDVYVVEQVPVYEFSGYSRQEVYVDKEHYRVHRVDYFDRKGELLKTLTTEDHQLYKNKYWRPMVSYMENVQTGKSTELVTETLEFDVGVDASDFNKNSLKRAR